MTTAYDNPTARAYEFAKAAHASIGQKRKYSGQDYIVHPEAVCRILEEAGEKDPNVLMAALLHDVLEDVAPQNKAYDFDEILRHFGVTVTNYVMDLTDQYTKENFPWMNREERKAQEAKRIATIANGSLKVKLADLLDNTADIMRHDQEIGRAHV